MTDAEAELRAFERAEQVEEFHALCEHSLAELITAGTTLAKAVATRLEFDVTRDLADRYGSAGFKGGMPAGKAFALASQSVRRSILLLRKLLQPGWWETPERETADARQGGAKDGPRDKPPGGDGEERLDRLERIEELDAVEAGPGRVAQTIADLKEDMFAAADRADAIWPGLGDAALAGEDAVAPFLAAKPQNDEDEDDAHLGPPRRWQDPPD